MDITALLYYLAMGLALVGADAYWNADSIVSKVEVAGKYAEKGLSADYATTLFAHEMQAIFANESIIRAPDIRAANEQSVISVIANSLKLEDLTYAFQHLFGLDPVQVKVAMLDDGSSQSILVTSTSRTRPPFTLLLPRDEKLEAPHFIRHAAIETASRLDPYHTSLYLLEKRDVDSHVGRLKELLQGSIDALPATPDNPQRALFRNLQGITALLENDVTRAAELFAQAVKDTDNYSAALLNLAFVQVEKDAYDQAIETLRPIIERRARPLNPSLEAAAYTTRATAHWAMKRHAMAERDFARAAAINPIGTDMYIYWALMLGELGRSAEATKLRLIGEQNLQSFEQFPEVAMLYFWLNEQDERALTRRTEPHPSHGKAKQEAISQTGGRLGGLLKD